MVPPTALKWKIRPGILRELYSREGGVFDGVFYLVDGSVEAALVDLEG
jgi:hypothetical protein